MPTSPSQRAPHHNSTPGLDPSCPGDDAGARRLLEAALEPGREELLRLLLPQRLPLRLRLCSPTKRSPLGGCSAVEEQGWRRLDLPAPAKRLQSNPAAFAVRHSSLPALRQLLAAGCPAGAVHGAAEPPPLVAAARRLDTARCTELLAAGAPAGEVDQRGRSALDAALELCTDARLVRCTVCELCMLLPVCCGHPSACPCCCPVSSQPQDGPQHPQIELTAEETQGASASTERRLLELVERLHGAGAPCSAFLAEHCKGLLPGQAPDQSPVVHPSLLLAAGVPAWSTATHHLWPPAFRRVARTLLLVLRGRGAEVRQATARADGAQALAVQRPPPAQRVRLQAGAASTTYALPLELCLAILGQAAAHVSAWVEEA